MQFLDGFPSRTSKVTIEERMGLENLTKTFIQLKEKGVLINLRSFGHQLGMKIDSRTSNEIKLLIFGIQQSMNDPLKEPRIQHQPATSSESSFKGLSDLSQIGFNDQQTSNSSLGFGNKILHGCVLDMKMNFEEMSYICDGELVRSA